MNATKNQKKNRQIALILIVAALGYFVDIYDLVLFGVVKAESLTQIMHGASEASIASTGKFLFNMQMLGMLIGEKTIVQLKGAFLLELELLFPVLMENYMNKLEQDIDIA